MTRRSPLHTTHAACGARFTMFGDWEMPLHYEGTLAEHAAVRSAVGVFDVSHLGRFGVRGPGAASLVDRLLCNDLRRIAPGRTQYTMMLTADGGVTDDIIVWWLDEEHIVVLPNSANHDRVLAAFTAQAPTETTVTDLRGTTVLLAVQGPAAPRLLESALGSAPRRSRLRRINDAGTIAAGTGYTGEAGGEVMLPVDRAEDRWRLLIDLGAVPCGLGARDTLRLEMGYPLWGQDLDESITPLEAGLDWAVGWDSNFVGRPALEQQRAEGVGRRRIGFTLHDRRPPRHGYPMRTADGDGTVTSGNYSPSLRRGIGMGYVAPPPGPGARLEIGIRDRWVPAVITDMPFVRR